MGFTYETMASHANLVYEIENEENIDTVTLGMITNNQIEGLIRPTLSQRNVSKYLKYNVTGKMSMKDYLQKIQRNVLLTILGSIVDTFEIAQEYMINEGTFILDKEYIFIDFNTYKASLISVPEIGSINTNSLEVFLKELLFSSSFDEEENRDYVVTLFNYLNSTSIFSVKELKKIIQELKNEKPEIQQKTHKAVSQPVPHQVERTYAAPTYSVKPKEERPVYIPESAVVNPQVVQPVVSNVSEIEEAQEEKKSKFGFFKKEKKEKKIKEKPVKKVSKTESLNFGFDIPGRDSLVPSPQSSAAQSVMPTKDPAPVSQPMNNQSANSYSSYAPSAGTLETKDIGIVGTVELTPQSFSGTVELNPTGYNSTSADYLHRLKTNGRFFMTGAVSRVGASSDLEVCITQNPAISSMHASIYKRGTIYYIKDENSKNHTYVDGGLVNSGEERQISNGTNIRLADEEFVFYIS